MLPPSSALKKGEAASSEKSVIFTVSTVSQPGDSKMSADNP